MKANTIFITVVFDKTSGAFDYPQNIALPRLGETIVMETKHGNRSGKVSDVRHIITFDLAEIKIVVHEE